MGDLLSLTVCSHFMFGGQWWIPLLESACTMAQSQGQVNAETSRTFFNKLSTVPVTVPWFCFLSYLILNSIRTSPERSFQKNRLSSKVM